MPRIIRSERARQDLADIFTYIANDNSEAAERFLIQLNRLIELLSVMPRIGFDFTEYGRGLRAFPIGRYRIFYRLISGGIEVVAVIHSARHLYQGMFKI